MKPPPPWLPRRLHHLRRDARGLPVPYINRWGPDDVAQYEIRHDRLVGGDAVFLNDDGQTVPDFTAQSMQRQRECTILGLCQVCGRLVPWSRRFLVVADLSINVIELGGEKWVSITEPWLDQECARIALERCPALIRRRRDEKLSAVQITSMRQVQLTISTGWIEGPYEAQTKENPVVMWAKILLPRKVTDMLVEMT